jgi:hypothetical protein
MGGGGKIAKDCAMGRFPSCGCLKIGSRPDFKEGAGVHEVLCSLDGRLSRKKL